MREQFEKHLEKIEDSRCHCNVEHKLSDVLIIIMCAVLCGVDTLQEMQSYGDDKRTFLKENFQIEKIPSQATISRILSMVDGHSVGICIINIMKDLIGSTGEVVAIDGKTICSTNKISTINKSIHIVSAYLTENGVTLAQLSVNEKTNEIPTVRQLLDMFEVEDKVITADAMHCQKTTAEKIIEKKGNYILQVKSNQELLFEDIHLYFSNKIAQEQCTIKTAKTSELNKNRHETRTYYMTQDINWMNNLTEWKCLTAIFAVHRKVVCGQNTSEETSYFITSLDTTPEQLLKHVREHWKIESMHWQLDVVFSEDDCQLHTKQGQECLNSFRKLALAVHKQYPQVKDKKFQ